MAERPILFNGEMVRSILSGAKTMTRRPIKPAPPSWADEAGFSALTPPGSVEFRGIHPTMGPGSSFVRCPFGVRGDVLWVRETLREGSDGWRYAADDAAVSLPTGDPRVGQMLSWAHHRDNEVCVSIHMPKWASRIRLVVTDVRAERLLDVTEADAVAEGMTFSGGYWTGAPHPVKGTPKCHNDARTAFLDLWQEIYGHKVYNNGSACVPKENPWVWAVTFKREMA